VKGLIKMSANAHHFCIVFSNNEIRAKEKLEEIACSAECTKKDFGRGYAKIVVGDEEWMWVRPSDIAKGYRAHKAWIDEQCTIEQLNNIILPICSMYCEEMKYF